MQPILNRCQCGRGAWGATLMEMTPQRPSRMWSPDRLASVSLRALLRLPPTAELAWTPLTCGPTPLLAPGPCCTTQGRACTPDSKHGAGLGRLGLCMPEALMGRQA